MSPVKDQRTKGKAAQLEQQEQQMLQCADQVRAFDAKVDDYDNYGENYGDDGEDKVGTGEQKVIDIAQARMAILPLHRQDDEYDNDVQYNHH